jgi:hypothetical protein
MPLVSRGVIDRAGHWMENLTINQDVFARIFIKGKTSGFNNAVV